MNPRVFSKAVNAYSVWTGVTDGYNYKHGTKTECAFNAVDTILSFVAFSALGAAVIKPIRSYCITATISYLSADIIKKDIESARAVISIGSSPS